MSASADLRAVADLYWNGYLARHPIVATTLSVRDHDHLLDDLSPEARDRWLGFARDLEARTEAIPAADLAPRERVTRSLLLHELGSQRLGATLRSDLWAVDQLGGPQVSLLDLPRLHRVTDRTSMDSYLARVRAIPSHFAQLQANLRAGLAAGLVAARCNVVRVEQQLVDLLAAGAASSPLLGGPAARPDGVDEAAWRDFREQLERAVADGVMPAFRSYLEMLRAELLPASRETPGLCALPGGQELYANAILYHVTLPRTADELHELGLAEMERIGADLRSLLAELLPGRPFDEAVRELRESRAHSFATREEIVDAATRAVRRATEAATRVFSLLPDHECVVRPIDAHAEKAAPAAFYLPPAPDGSRPGTYFVNTFEPQSRPRHDAEVVAFHEAVPGHHLQIALAQKIQGVPEFQRHAGATSFIEGWALYTESLSLELSLYTGKWDLLGMHACDAWRAARLVVDTGLHAKGWSRERAVEYMAQTTLASRTDIEAEVDRYVAWPGQALSYKTGQLEILALRRRAEQALGSRFDIKDFHRVVLENGGVTLPVLREQVEGWIAAG